MACRGGRFVAFDQHLLQCNSIAVQQFGAAQVKSRIAVVQTVRFTAG
jgi:hypothetical protein